MYLVCLFALGIICGARDQNQFGYVPKALPCATSPAPPLHVFVSLIFLSLCSVNDMAFEEAFGHVLKYAAVQ